MKRTFLILGLAALLLPSAFAAPRQIKLGTLYPDGTSVHRSLQQMGEEWKQATSGNAVLRIYAGGQMGSEAAMVGRMRIGQLQAATLSVSGLAEIDPSVSALQKMPLMFRSLEEAEHVRALLIPELEEKLLAKGFVVLFWGDAGWVRLFARRPALRPDDFRKMHVFAGAGDNEQVQIMRGLGFQVRELEWSDALIGLQTGMIDALPTVPYHALAGQFYTVANHMLEVNYVPLVGATVVTRKVWESFSAEERIAMLGAAKAAGEKISATTRAENDQAVEAMRKRGLQVHRLTPEAAKEWDELGRETHGIIRGRIVPAEMFDKVVRLLEQHRAEKAARK
jgi:TRAP-type C4-dicarboxylate transport system substrate-binding protein